MSPQEALARKLQTNPSTSRQIDVSVVGTRSGVESRLATIISEISSTPTEKDASEFDLSVRRTPSQALSWFMPVDALALAAGFIFAWFVAAFVNSAFFGRSVSDVFVGVEGMRLAQFVAVAAGTMLWFENTGHYRTRMPFWMEVQKVVTTFLVAMVVDGFINFASKQDFSRLWLMSGWGFAAAVLLFGRSFVRVVLSKRGLWQVRTILVGSGSTAEDARSALESEPGLGYQVVKQIDNLPQSLAQVGQSWRRLCDKYKADYIIVALDGKDLTDAEQHMASLLREYIPFSVSPPLRHIPVIGMVPQSFFNHDTVLMTRNDKLDQPLARFFKRFFDIVMSSMALLALSPVMLFLALLVKLDGGPALFGHKRLGFKGRSFRCLKFRSMVVDGDGVLSRHFAENPEAVAEWQRVRKLRSDPRITLIGNFLRKTSLDELPQLINVLCGEMSLVGPRPIVVAEVGKYKDDIAYYYRVRPGITGLWQVSGRSDVSYERRVQMDSWYVRNWSMWHDIAILCKTVPALLQSRGAY